MRVETTKLYYLGSRRLLLEELLDEMGAEVPVSRLLLRASEARHRERILTYGTDRGGYPEGRRWRYNRETGRDLAHEEVVYATTVEENRRAETTPASCSLKKLDVIDDPLLLVYDAEGLYRVWDRQFAFDRSRSPKDSLLAVFPVVKIPPADGWFTEADGLCYRTLAATVRDGTIVEVGTWMGRSASYLTGVCGRHRNRLVCVDWWDRGSGDGYDRAYREAARDGAVEARFDGLMARLAFAPEKLRCSSLEAAARFLPGAVDMVFLDGSHDTRSVVEDIGAWLPKVRPGGILAGHDYKEKHAGVRRAVDELAARGFEIRHGGDSLWWTAPR